MAVSSAILPTRYAWHGGAVVLPQTQSGRDRKLAGFASLYTGIFSDENTRIRHPPGYAPTGSESRLLGSLARPGTSPPCRGLSCGRGGRRRW